MSMAWQGFMKRNKLSKNAPGLLLFLPFFLYIIAYHNLFRRNWRRNRGDAYWFGHYSDRRANCFKQDITVYRYHELS